MTERLGALLFLGVLTVALAGSLVVHYTLGVPLGFALMIFFVGWPLGGTLITADDDLPGGWSNPDGSVRPPWLEAPFWGYIAAGLAVSAAGFALEAGWRSRNGIDCWLCAAAGASLAHGLIARRWWFLGGAVAMLGLAWW